MAIRPVHNEQLLLEAVAGGDEAAFAELFRVYHQPLAEFVFLVTRSMPWTEDIVQDVFIKVWLKRDTLPGLDSFTKWLFTLSRNYTLNALSKQASQRSREVDWSSSHVEMEIGPGDEAAPGDTYRVLLAAAVDRLPRVTCWSPWRTPFLKNYSRG